MVLLEILNKNVVSKSLELEKIFQIPSLTYLIYFSRIKKKMKIMIDVDIILEMSDLLTELTYSINQPDSKEYFELLILLKNLYDSIGYYTYDVLDVLMTLLKMNISLL